jgi:hypothetical protein
MTKEPTKVKDPNITYNYKDEKLSPPDHYLWLTGVFEDGDHLKNLPIIPHFLIPAIVLNMFFLSYRVKKNVAGGSSK